MGASVPVLPLDVDVMSSCLGDGDKMQGKDSGPLAERKAWPRGLNYFAKVKREQINRKPIRILDSQSDGVDSKRARDTAAEQPSTAAIASKPLSKRYAPVSYSSLAMTSMTWTGLTCSAHRRKQGHWYTPVKAPPTRAEVERLLAIERLFESNEKLGSTSAAPKPRDTYQVGNQPTEATEMWKHIRVAKDVQPIIVPEKEQGVDNPDADAQELHDQKRVRFEELARGKITTTTMPKGTPSYPFRYPMA